jgi:signal transduction histidine kinase
MSHELRTPLNHIIGFTELILTKRFGDLNEIQEEYLNDVHGSSHHLLSLVNDILDVSKVEAGKLELKATVFSPSNLIENSMVLVKEKALKHSIQIATHINSIPATIAADERMLKQILYNLLSNAVKFTPDGGKVTVKASQYKFAQNTGRSENKTARPGIQVCVSDTGIGIHPDDFKRIFNPFEQVENSNSRKFQGTGLGLALTKKLVGLHGGKIWVESDGVGKGATFIFCIPDSDCQ